MHVATDLVVCGALRAMTDLCLGTETLVDFVEGRADDAIRARIEHHASHCEHCRSVLSSLARGSSTTNVMPVGTPTRPSDPALELAADMTVGRYIIQRALGAGGMGVVYAARDPELDRVVAVKVLRGDGGPGMQERLRREAKAMAQVAHPNVVAVYDVGAIGERIFIAMEYIDGVTLTRWLTTPRPQHEILDAYRDAGRGLAIAHAAGIVHRDFKPENVLVGKDGRVRVVDFGLARTSGTEPASMFRSAGTTPISADAPTEVADLTQTGAMVGTPYYMAPELYDGAAGDARSDQFSLCVALFTSLYGQRPFDGDTIETLAANLRAGRINEPASSRVPRRIRTAIRRGLSVDPAARFASIDELLVELEPPSKLRVVIPVAALAAIAVGVGVWMLSPSADAPDQRCTGAVAAFAPVWNPARRAAIDKTFGASHLPYAPFAAHEVDAALDRYAEGWIAAHTDACRASQIRGEQTEAMLDRRMLCLARRKQETTALVDALAAADDAVVGRRGDVRRRDGPVADRGASIGHSDAREDRRADAAARGRTRAVSDRTLPRRPRARDEGCDRRARDRVSTIRGRGRSVAGSDRTHDGTRAGEGVARGSGVGRRSRPARRDRGACLGGARVRRRLSGRRLQARRGARPARERGHRAARR